MSSNSLFTFDEKDMRTAKKPSPLQLQPVVLAPLPLSEKELPPVQVSKITYPPIARKPVSPPVTASSIAPQEPSSPVSPASTSKEPFPYRQPQSRPTSYLPRISFSGSLQENFGLGFLQSTPNNSSKGRRSYRASAYTQPPLSAVTEMSFNSPTAPVIPIPPKSALRARRTLSPHEEVERPVSRLPTGFDTLPNTSRKDVSENPSASKSGGRNATSAWVDAQQMSQRKRKSSNAASLAALTGSPVQSYFPSRPPSLSNFPQPPPSPPTDSPEQDVSSSRGRRSRSSSATRGRQSSSRSLTRTRDSVHYLANTTRARSSSTSNRHSIQRDALHYDPTSQYRTRSGSVQGRTMDFSTPRETPFSDAKSSYKTHTPQTSTGSANSFMTYYTTSHSVRNSLQPQDNSAPELPTGSGSRLRLTMDNFGTKDMNLLARQSPIPRNDFQVNPRSSSIDPKISNDLNRIRHKENLKRSGTVSVAKVGRRKPQRVSNHIEEYYDSLIKPGFGQIETASTVSSTASVHPRSNERYASFVRM